MQSLLDVFETAYPPYPFYNISGIRFLMYETTTILITYRNEIKHKRQAWSSKVWAYAVFQIISEWINPVIRGITVKGHIQQPRSNCLITTASPVLI